MPRVVVDTDVLSYLMKRDSRGDRFRRFLEGKLVVVSFQTVAELFAWATRRGWGEQRKRALQERIARCLVYEYTFDLCKRWAEITVQCEKDGRRINTADAWIAATALETECPLVTNNVGDFGAVKGLEILHPDRPT